MFGGSSAKPPPPPPPPPNPPTYASAVFAAPSSNTGVPGGLFSNAILTSPLGASDQRATQRKQLFGQ